MNDVIIGPNYCKECIRVDSDLREAYQVLFNRLWLQVPHYMSKPKAENFTAMLTTAAMAAACPDCTCDDCTEDKNNKRPHNAYQAFEVAMDLVS